MSILSLATFGIFEEGRGGVAWEGLDHVPSCLSHRCVVEEKQTVGTDDGGQAVQAWVTLWENVPCRLISPSTRRMLREVREESLADYILQLPLGLAVREFEMRVKGVVDEYGRAVVGRAEDVYEILGQSFPINLIAGGIQSVGVRLIR